MVVGNKVLKKLIKDARRVKYGYLIFINGFKDPFSMCYGRL